MLPAWLGRLTPPLCAPLRSLLLESGPWPLLHPGNPDEHRERERERWCLRKRHREGRCKREREKKRDRRNDGGVALTASRWLAAWMFAWPFACMFACLPSCPIRRRRACLLPCLTMPSETGEWGNRTERERHSTRIWPLGWAVGDVSGKLAGGVAELMGGRLAG